MPDGPDARRRPSPHAADRVGARRVVGRGLWTLAVGVFLAIGIAGPVKIADRQLGRRSAVSAGVGTDVHMAALKFDPAGLVVRRGSAVHLDNNDVVPHTVTEDGAAGIDSGVLGPGKSFRIVVERRLVYHCAIHPSMKATIELAG